MCLHKWILKDEDINHDYMECKKCYTRKVIYKPLYFNNCKTKYPDWEKPIMYRIDKSIEEYKFWKQYGYFPT
jgi:hypothetical protein